MSLRDQILAVPETVSDLAWAAEQRYREAEHLLLARRFSGAVYLLGIAAEMWMKIAVFRYRGAIATSPIAGLLRPVRDWMRVRAPAVDPESYHSLEFWAECLLIARSAGRELSATIIGDVRHHVVGRLHEDWKIDLRYRLIPQLDERHAWRVYLDVTWVRQNWDKLWR